MRVLSFCLFLPMILAKFPICIATMRCIRRGCAINSVLAVLAVYVSLSLYVWWSNLSRIFRCMRAWRRRRKQHIRGKQQTISVTHYKCLLICLYLPISAAAIALFMREHHTDVHLVRLFAKLGAPESVLQVLPIRRGAKRWSTAARAAEGRLSAARFRLLCGFVGNG